MFLNPRKKKIQNFVVVIWTEEGKIKISRDFPHASITMFILRFTNFLTSVARKQNTFY